MDFFKICEGIPVRISDHGKGAQAVVLLHGYLETLDVWEDFAELLEPHCRVLSIDLPGHGLSGTRPPIHTMEFMADVVASAMDACGIKEATIVGHSLGGYVALAFARKYQERTAKLCLFHSTPNPDTEEKKLARDREIALIESGRLDLLLKVSLSKMYADDNVKRMADRIEEAIEDIAISEPEGIAACLRGMKEREDMNDFLLAFEKPSLLIFGAKDNFTTPEIVAGLMTKFTRSQHLLLEQSGHIGFVEEPEKSLEALLAFVRQ